MYIILCLLQNNRISAWKYFLFKPLKHYSISNWTLPARIMYIKLCNNSIHKICVIRILFLCYTRKNHTTYILAKIENKVSYCIQKNIFFFGQINLWSISFFQIQKNMHSDKGYIIVIIIKIIDIKQKRRLLYTM